MPAVALKVAVEADGEIATIGGVVRKVLLSDKATDRPVEGAALLRLIVHVLLAPEAKVWGAQVSPITVTLVFIAIVELALEPLAAAVTVAEWSLEMVPAVAEKLTALVPAGIETEAGPVNDAEFIMEIATGRPAAGAAPLAVIVQVLAAPELRAFGAQASEVSVTSGVTLSTAVFEKPFNAAVMTAD